MIDHDVHSDPGYLEADVFVSYAWLDNLPPTVVNVQEDVHRWVWMFADGLKGALTIKLGRAAKVWIDKRETRAADRVSVLLTEELARSRLLVVLMSPSWLGSKWGLAELEEFRRTHPGTQRREDVLVVEIEPVERDQWAGLVDVNGMPFYREVRSGSRVFARLGDPVPELTDKLYFNELTSLASEISAYLKHGPKRRAASATAPTPDATLAPFARTGSTATVEPVDTAQPEVPQLWLADASPSLADERRDLVAAVLQDHFAYVEPGVQDKRLLPPSVSLEQLRGSMKSAAILVQLLDDDVGPTGPNAHPWYQLQAEEASRHATRQGVPFVKWRRRGSLDATRDKLHREVLLGAVEQSIEELRRDVLNHLRCARGDDPSPAGCGPFGSGASSDPGRFGGPGGIDGFNSAYADGAPVLCMTYTEDDSVVAEQVGKMLSDLDVIYDGIPTPTRVYDHHDADLKNDQDDQLIQRATGIIIIYGRAAPEWLSSTIMRLNQLRGRRGRWGALIDAPAPVAKPLPRMASTILRLDWRDKPRLDLLSAYVESLRGAAHG